MEIRARLRAMKIRAKLIFLVIGVVGLLAVAIGVYALLLGPIDQIEREKAYLIALSDAFKDQLSTINTLVYAPLNSGSQSFGDTSQAVDDAFANLAKVKVLPRLSKGIRAALDVIANLKDMNDKRLSKMSADYDVLKADAAQIFYFPDEMSFVQFYTDEIRPEKRQFVPPSKPHFAAFLSDLHVMQDSISASTDTIGEQYSIIEKAIGATQAKAFTIAAAIILGIMGLTVVFALILANGIARSIIRIEHNIALLKEGDLSGRSNVKSRDEIGILAHNLNLFLDGLSSALYRIKEISKSNVDLKDRLLGATAEATSSATQIESSTRSIGRQIEVFDSRIAMSVDSIGKIVGNVIELDAQIEGQTSMAEEATASVTEILSSLENMSRITEHDRASAEELVLVSERGRSVFQDAFAKIGEISLNVGTIREMAAVIQNIASRTNLLAMNAAIEAAHAGEAGRGFAVVADEIRKLSEASTKSSRDISESIKKIVARIDESTAANDDMGRAFAAIDERIKDVSKSMSEIYSNISEIQVGSKQILQAMVNLQERSVHVKEGSKAMEEGSEEIKQKMDELSRISTEVTSNISEISSGIADIGASIRLVAELADKVGSGSGQLDGEMGRFKTAAEEAAVLEAAE